MRTRGTSQPTTDLQQGAADSARALVLTEVPNSTFTSLLSVTYFQQRINIYAMSAFSRYDLKGLVQPCSEMSTLTTSKELSLKHKTDYTHVFSTIEYLQLTIS